jgi:hypothetical protein
MSRYYIPVAEGYDGKEYKALLGSGFSWSHIHLEDGAEELFFKKDGQFISVYPSANQTLVVVFIEGEGPENAAALADAIKCPYVQDQEGRVGASPLQLK